MIRAIPYLEGNRHIVKQKFQKLESDSCSPASCRTTLEFRFASELGRSSSVLPAGNLMKRLLADEMCKETESSRQTPSIIAKLMGLDRIPPQQGSNRKPKKLFHSLNGKTVSSGTCKHMQSWNNHSCRKIASQQLFKDIYEVRESLEGHSEGYRFQVSSNRKHKENEMALIRQKFMDAKRLSIDEKLEGSKECHDTIDALTSHNHLFLKFLREPDLLYTKHLHDLHASLQSNCGNAQVSDKSVAFLSRGMEATSIAPTKIVLLKPNLGRSQKTAKSFSSPSSRELLPDADMCKNNQMDARNGAAELWGKKRLPIELDFSAHKYQESRVLAKEITRQMKSKLGEASSNVPSSRYRRYSADESSYDTSDNDSSYERGAALLACQTRNRSSFQGKSSSSRYAESSVDREGKKRLSERWKVAHKSPEIRLDKGTTLGEMLSIPDIDNWSANLDGDLAENGSSRPVKPLGISSKDGWKDGCRNLSRSTSLPSSCDLLESYHKQLVSRKVAGHGRKKAINRDLSWTEGSSYRNRRVRDMKRHSSRRMSEEMVNDEEDEHLGGSGKKSVLEDKDSPELKTVILETPTCFLDTNLNLQSIMDVEHEHNSASLNSHNDLFPAAELSIEVQVKDHSTCIAIHESASQESLRTLENDGSQSCLQNLVAQPESPVSSKETDQPSPVSVLEAPFSEDVLLGTERFERVSTELHGLRKQLELLKLESKASVDQGEGNFLISSDNNEEKSAANKPTVAESSVWEASYTADVLAELELEQTDPNQVGPSWVFEKLEKKYNDQGSGFSSRSNRRLVFDRIKCGLMETAQGSMSLYPWVKTSHGNSIGIRLTAMEEVLQSELQWMNAGIYIDGIGRELWKMMLDELIVESLVM